MPSYYDSKGGKPGKPKVKYAEGGLTKKMRHGGLIENGHDVTNARGSGAARPQRFKKNG